MAVLAVKLHQVNGQFGTSHFLLDAVETRMLGLVKQTSALPHGVEPIAQQAAAYHLTSGGQRIRAQLAIEASLASKLSLGDAVSIAAASELVHNASLIHDDLQDSGPTRHGVDTVWSAYGVEIAVCAGDLLLSAAYCALAGVSRTHLLPMLISVLHHRISDASIGQCADLSNNKRRVFSLDDYQNFAALKSGSLFSLPIELALAAGGELQAITVARRAAESFAIGYQIFDDLNDVQEDLSRCSSQPAINVVAVMHANNGSGDARALASKLAIRHLDIAAESSLLLPHQSGQLLHRLALDFSAHISLASI